MDNLSNTLEVERTMNPSHTPLQTCCLKGLDMRQPTKVLFWRWHRASRTYIFAGTDAEEMLLASMLLPQNDYIGAMRLRVAIEIWKGAHMRIQIVLQSEANSF